MKTTLAFIGMAFMLCITVSAQWAEGNPFAVWNHYQGAWYTTPTTGMHVYGGDNPYSNEGGLIQDDNGFHGYIFYQSPLNLRAVHGMVVGDTTFYWAVGNEGLSGAAFFRQRRVGNSIYENDLVGNPWGQAYTSVQFLDKTNGFVGGFDGQNGILASTTNRGSTWDMDTLIMGQPISDIHFVNANLGFASSGGYQRLINDGVMLPDSGAIYRTTNGGMDWEQIHSDPDAGFSAVHFLDTQTGFAVGNEGSILRTDDGGNSWTATNVVLAGTPFVLTGIDFGPAGVGHCSGYRIDGSEGFMLYSGDGGNTWTQNYSSGASNFCKRVHDVFLYDDDLGKAPAHMKVLTTTNGGGISTGLSNRTSIELTVSPNPATDIIQWTGIEGVSYAILSSTGRLVEQGGIVQRNEALVSGLASGFYMLVVQTEKGPYRASFIKQ